MNALIMREIGDRTTIREIAGRICDSMNGALGLDTALELVTAAYEYEAQYLRSLGAGDGLQASYDEDEAFDYIVDHLVEDRCGVKCDVLAQVVDDYIAYENDYLENQGKLIWRALAKGA
jgi:hypothetical protein